MPKLQTLWVDQLVSLKEGEIPLGFEEICETLYCSDSRHLTELLTHREVDLVCFDFDYPDRTGLRMLRDVKAAHPSLPIVMLTVQHSESLAIWAFRNKIWDYLVKPVPQHEIERCLSALMEAATHRKSQTAREVASHAEKIPDEIAFAPKAEQQSLAPAICYVEQNFRSRVRSEKVAALCGLTPVRFSRQFKDVYGVTFRDYLVKFRLKEACRLLENPTVSVADVAFAVGFQDPSYFTRIFKDRIGITPSLLIGQAVPATTETNRPPVIASS
jgi:YesN/AraC family two-component response regulator